MLRQWKRAVGKSSMWTLALSSSSNLFFQSLGISWRVILSTSFLSSTKPPSSIMFFFHWSISSCHLLRRGSFSETAEVEYSSLWWNGSTTLLISSQTLASAPFSIACFSVSSKILPEFINSSFELLSVASLIGASGATSASFSRLPFSSLAPITGILYHHNDRILLHLHHWQNYHRHKNIEIHHWEENIMSLHHSLHL